MDSWLPWTKRPLIVSAPMLDHANGTLAAEVSKAGGFGMVPGGYDFSPSSAQTQILDSELTKVRGLLGSSSSSQSDDAQLPVGVGFITFHNSSVHHFPETTLPVLAKHRVAAVWLFAPDPTHQVDDPKGESKGSSESTHRFLIRHLHSAGIKAIVQLGSVAAAREAINDGADVIVAQGSDAGGHQFASGASVMSLVPEVRRLLDVEFADRKISLLAAGGIADGRGVAAALMLGADGAVMGSRFVASIESSSADWQKHRLVELTDGGVSTVKSTMHDNFRGPNPWPSLYDGRAVVTDSYRNASSGASLDEVRSSIKSAEEAKDYSKSIMWCGTGAGLITEILPAGVIVQQTREAAQSRFHQVVQEQC